MKKKTATITAVLLTAAIVTATGCTKNSTQPSATPNSTNATNSNDSTPITFSMYSADPNQDWDDMQSGVGKKIKEKTGVTLKIEFPVGPSDQKVGLMASSGEYPDLVMAKGDTRKLIDAGAMLDLTPLIDKYGPNIKKVYGDYLKRLRLSNDDHAIYQLPTAQVNQKYFDSEGGFELQHQVLKELGYPKIKTLQDYENAIKAYKEKHPTMDGKPTIGLSLIADDWRILISVTNPAFYTTGAPDDGEFYIDPKTYEASSITCVQKKKNISDG